MSRLNIFQAYNIRLTINHRHKIVVGRIVYTANIFTKKEYSELEALILLLIN